ncbi:MAG: GNAT family N-acetyltransferase [Candidatus Hodarchaeales archaeon]|jgi:acyl-CoA hydrolase/N-acetylglutamate synthase-like GNAT family acetyltransferase
MTQRPVIPDKKSLRERIAELTRNKKCISPRKAIEKINPGDHVYIGGGCGEPPALVKALNEGLSETGDEFSDIEIYHFISLESDSFTRDFAHESDLYRHNTFLIGEGMRDLVHEGLSDYTPVSLFEVPDLFKSGKLYCDMSLIQVSPPDEHGSCSFGVSVDLTKPIAENSSHIIAEINPWMPRTLGDSFINLEDIDYFVLNDTPILEFEYEPADSITRRIARHVSGLVRDEDTLQIGIGNIPNAVIGFLEDKKDLGVHTCCFSDGIVDLVESGVITGRKKTLSPNKIITSFVMGTRRLYRFVDDNSLVEFHSIDYVNDPFVIARNDNQIAVNSAFSIDLTGQVNAESHGYQFYSGTGFLIDFARGTIRSKGGRSIIVLPSTSLDGKDSKIVPWIGKGSGVTLTRWDVDWVVTEYGAVHLRGRTIRERVLDLISIAHPKFREELLEAAKKYSFVYPDQVLSFDEQGRVVLYPEKYETQFKLKNSEFFLFRPVKATDEQGIRQLFHKLEDKEKFFRFFKETSYFSEREGFETRTVDYQGNFAACVLDNSPARKIIAVGRYFVNPSTGFAEVAFMVHNHWRNRGITTTLMRYLKKIAREHGIRGFYGSIELENEAMIRIVQRAAEKHVLETILDDDGQFRFAWIFN